MPFFEYGEAEIAYLKKRDKALGRVIDALGMIRREIRPDPFSALLYSIISQQISGKASDSIWARFVAAFPGLSACEIADASPDSFRQCGVSPQKAAYLQSAAQAFAHGELAAVDFSLLSDAEICQKLTQIRGVGLWTAEMLLIFSLGRMNVLSYGDLAILRGLRMLYRRKEITPQIFSGYQKRYAPYASVASLYLWEVAGGKVDGLRDPLRKKKAG